MLGWLLDRPALLRFVSRFAASTDARDLGALTLSILQAETGRQDKELRRLLEFLELFQPDLVQLTNAMFLGIGSSIRNRLGIPVVSGLTGEDLFLDELPAPYRSQVEAEMRHQARNIDGFLATSRYYAGVMETFLEVDSTRMHVVPLGINYGDFQAASSDVSDSTVTLGYLARICPEKGLHLLVDAFHILRQRLPDLPLRLKVAGYLGARDMAYFEEQQKKIASWGLSQDVDFLAEVDRPQKLDLLRDIDLLSVPTTYREPKGLFVLEGWAAGVPAVLPRHGAFVELIESTGAGLLVDPESPSDLARGLQQLIENPDERRQQGQKGRQAVESEFNTQMMTRRTEEIYSQVVKTARGADGKGVMA